MPRAPGEVELTDVRKLIMSAGRGVPTLFETIADEPKEARASSHLDQEPRDRITLTVEAHQVFGIVLDREESSEWDFAAPREQIEGDLVVAATFTVVFTQE